METPFRPLDSIEAIRVTGDGNARARATIDRVAKYIGDVEQAERKAAHCCKACWYIVGNRVGGAAMTTWYCGVCAGKGTHGSTAHDRVCPGCAQVHDLCRRCGGDREGRDRRRNWPTPARVP